MKMILILAGTREARDLAGRLADLPGLEITASLAGVTSDPCAYPVPVRRGGFGGADGLRDWLTSHAVDAIVDCDSTTSR